jgi:hypothetical protein
VKKKPIASPSVNEIHNTQHTVCVHTIPYLPRLSSEVNKHIDRHGCSFLQGYAYGVGRGCWTDVAPKLDGRYEE